MKNSLEDLQIELQKHHLGSDLWNKYYEKIIYLSQKSIFLETIEKSIIEAIKTKNFDKFNNSISLIQSFGKDSINQRKAYNLMMEFIIKNIKINCLAKEEIDTCIELVLDIFWHQPKALKEMNKESQVKLFETLKRTTTYKYEKNVDSFDEPFFAIKKSIDLIKYQNEFGNTEELNELYLNHFDIHIREEARGIIK